ncbi:MAG: dihydrofolate reductase [Lentimicrobiaceae bacterium]|nr:dihydrofolate reductase [Lentimicrobiaceae bacterium]
MKNNIPISIIVAIAKNYAIGKDNKLLWHISADLKRFKKLTTGNTIIMGRKTYLSLPRKPLPDRKNIVLTRSKNFEAEGCVVVNNIEQVFENLSPNNENFVIGGESVYRLFMPYANKLYLTVVDREYEADTFFPKINFDEWNIIDEEHLIANDDLHYKNVTLLRKQ